MGETDRKKDGEGGLGGDGKRVNRLERGGGPDRGRGDGRGGTRPEET